MFVVCGVVCAGESALNLSDLKLDSRGGLIVYVGGESIGNLASISKSGQNLVHVLCQDKQEFERVRGYIASHNLSGNVTVSVFDGKTLPFVDNCVNAIIVNSEKFQPQADPSSGAKVNSSEIERVLAPRGKLISNIEYRISDIEFRR